MLKKSFHSAKQTDSSLKCHIHTQPQFSLKIPFSPPFPLLKDGIILYMADPIPGATPPEIQEVEVLKADIRVQSAEEIKQQLLDVQMKAEEIRKEIKESIRTRRELPTFSEESESDRRLKSKAVDVKQAVVKVLLCGSGSTQKDFQNSGKSPTENILINNVVRIISEHVKATDVREQNAPYLHIVLYKALYGGLTNIEELARVFEEAKMLQGIDPALYKNLQKAMVEIAKDHMGISREEAERRFGMDKLEAQETERMRGQSQMLNELFNKFPEKEDRELLKALYSDEIFPEYIKEQYKACKDNHPGLSEKDLGIIFSGEFREKIIFLFGKLYQSVNEAKPGEFFEKIEQRGGIWNSTQILSDDLQRQLQRIRRTSFGEGSIVNEILWSQEKPIEGDVMVEVEDPHNKGNFIYEARRYAKPFTNPQNVGFSDFFNSIFHHVLTDIEVERFLHNARALPHNPPGEHGYYAQLSQYAEQMMPMTTLDGLLRLPDADIMLVASSLLDKHREASFAKYNWLHQPTSEQIDPNSNMTPAESEVFSRMTQIFRDKNIPEWRIKRAIAMASGYNYSISLRAIEVGSLADPPKKDVKGSEKTYWSYEQRDSAMYRVFNQMAHENLRFSTETLLLGNLIFLPVEGKNIGSARMWDHSSLMDEMDKNIEEFGKGRSKEDEKNGILRWINFLNPGKVGSIYTRGGWRDYASYEVYLVRTQDGKMDVLESWKALENIGVELLNNFVKDGIDKYFYETEKKGLPKKEYEDKCKETQNNRQNLVKYLYKTYYGLDPDKDTEKEEFEKLFQKLEQSTEPTDLKKSYKEFFYKVITRAIRQRIPTKFLRMERTKDVSGRLRMWQMVKNECHFEEPGFTAGQVSEKPSKFETAVDDVSNAEALLRQDISAEIRKQVNEKGKAMHEVVLPEAYELTEDNLKIYLDRICPGDAERKDRALKLYKVARSLAIKKIEGPDGKSTLYVDVFAKKYEGGFPFAIAVEEFDGTLMAHRGSGDRTIARAISEIAGTEKNVTEVIGKYLEVLKQTSLSGKQDYSEILKSIKTAKEYVEGTQGKEPAQKLAHHMAALAISFFKRDTAAKWVGGIFGIGEKNSLAAEFAGSSALVWEWDSKEIDAFCTSLESQNILPRFPYEINKTPTWKPWVVKIFGKERKTPFKVRDPDITYTTTKLRKEFGGDAKAVTFDMLNKYIPLALLILLFFWLKKSFQEFFGDKKK